MFFSSNSLLVSIILISFWETPNMHRQDRWFLTWWWGQRCIIGSSAGPESPTVFDETKQECYACRRLWQGFLILRAPPTHCRAFCLDFFQKSKLETHFSWYILNFWGNSWVISDKSCFTLSIWRLFLFRTSLSITTSILRIKGKKRDRCLCKLKDKIFKNKTVSIT